MARSLYYGFNPPFYRPGRVMATQTDERLIKNDLLQLILTVPGERAFRPSFGTELKGTMFEPIDDFSMDDLRTSIANAILNFEPRVKVSEILIDRKPDDNEVRIKIYAALTIEPNRILELNVSLPIGATPTQTIPNQVP